jgi:hypothetical protein
MLRKVAQSGLKLADLLWQRMQDAVTTVRWSAAGLSENNRCSVADFFH